MQEGIDIFSIGVGFGDKGELEQLASSPDNVMKVSRYVELPSTLTDLQRHIFACKLLSLATIGIKTRSATDHNVASNLQVRDFAML